MGGTSASKVPLTMADTDGDRSIVSPPLEEFVTADKFWEMYEQNARAGLDVGMMGWMGGITLKSHDVTELGDGAFRVGDIVTGGMFGEIDAKFYFDHSFDKEAREWTTTVYHSEFKPEEIKEVVHIKELSAPFRLEIWSVVELQRQPDLVSVIEPLWQGVLEAVGFEGKVTCEASPASSFDGKPCTVSSVIEMPADQYLAEYVKILKQGLQKLGIDQHKLKEDSDSRWVMEDSFVTGVITQDVFTFDAAQDTLISTIYHCPGELHEQSKVERYVTKIIREPFRLEVFKETLPGRKCSYDTMGAVQASIDKIVDGQASGGSWFS